jgi:hypothetical protein
MLVNFSVPPDVTPEYTRFYHHEFLPCLMEHSPAIFNIRRYEEFGVGGTLRWYNKQYLTIYQMHEGTTAKDGDEIFQNPAVAGVLKRFKEWKEKSIFNFSRIMFERSWTHKRQDTEPFSGPFFLWQLEMKPEHDLEFKRWYENDYLPLQVADIPTWASVRRYQSQGQTPVRHLTCFEAAHEPGLLRSIEDLRSNHRIEQNYEWQKRVEPAVSWHDASSFRPIYRLPD